MTEGNSFEKALELLSAGYRREAAVILLQLYSQAKSKELKIHVLDALMVSLDPVTEETSLIELCSEGIKLSQELGKIDIKAHFMGRKAHFLAGCASIYQYDRANLKLAEGWIGFSTETDKNVYEKLTKDIQDLELEIDRLLEESVVLANERQDKRLLASILMSRGSVAVSRYFSQKMDHPRIRWKAKLSRLLQNWGYDAPLIYGLKYSQALETYIKSFVTDCLLAAKLYEEIDDEEVGRVYFNLALHMKSVFHFREARKYLNRAKLLAERYNDTFLLKEIQTIAHSIKVRNRDVPNYVQGETR